MKLEQIVTLASEETHIEFLAMERSLRATGCKLPMSVIPYDDSRFALPDGSEWWVDEPLFRFLAENEAHPAMRKYCCLATAQYQFVDTDVCFLRNPETVLAPCDGFVTSCGHWHNPAHTVTDLSKELFSRRTTTWQQQVFNSGQFACDRVLYSRDELEAAVANPRWAETTLHWPHNEQPGLNLLVLLAGIQVTNLTLPPHRMQSTWAGDYPAGFEDYWIEDPARKPYLIHWAGTAGHGTRPIDSLYRNYLTASERAELDRRKARRRPVRRMQSLWSAFRSI